MSNLLFLNSCRFANKILPDILFPSSLSNKNKKVKKKDYFLLCPESSVKVNTRYPPGKEMEDKIVTN
jgi:hypothetical protein